MGPLCKHVFIHFIGPKASTVKKGQWNSKVPNAEAEVRKFFAIHFKMTAHDLDDMELPAIIEELRRLTYNVDDKIGELAQDQPLTRSLDDYFQEPRFALDQAVGN